MMSKLIAALLVCFALLPGICHADEAAPANVMVNESGTWFRADQQLTKDDFGKTVTVKAGSLVGLSLAENLTTGYMWHCNWTPEAGARLLRNAAADPAQVLPGAGGSRHYLLLFAKPGTVRLQPQYGRWWKNGARNPVQTIIVNVTK